MSLASDIVALITKESKLLANRISFFSYDTTAYENDIADGVASFNAQQHNNIPLENVVNLSSLVVNEGVRDQSSSFPFLYIDHFFGRVSYNLNKLVDLTIPIFNLIINGIDQPNGLVALDSNGRVKDSQLPESTVKFQGAWNASTNTPDLNTVPKGNGYMYIVSVSGEQHIPDCDSTIFKAGDQLIYNGSIWQRIPISDVDTVNGASPDSEGNVDVTGNNTVAIDGVTTISQHMINIKAGLGLN